MTELGFVKKTKSSTDICTNLAFAYHNAVS